MALDGARRTTRNDPDRGGRWWRGHAWWRGIALVYAAVAAVGAAPILRYAVTYWQPCFHNDYDSPACRTIQSHDIVGAFTYEGIETALALSGSIAAIAALTVGRRERRAR